VKILALIWGLIISWLFPSTTKNLDPIRGYVIKTPEITVTKFIVPSPTIKIIAARPTEVGYTGVWGKAQQIGEDTWTMKVGMDSRMATPTEILEALNAYRARFGSQKLEWNQRLADYAQGRVESFVKAGQTDAHAGFKDFVEKQDGYNKLGFNWLGENISYGFQLEGVHLIEWMYAGDKPHDDNQKNPRWDHVGVGVKGTATCLIFATSPR
jgi:uncharacterized protein YkwD